jgi:peroxiredoxin Q/BCP
MITEGKKAPVFSLESDEGKKLSLKDFAGKTVVLYFYPKDMTSGCTQESCDFQASLKQFQKKKAVVIGVSRDSVKSHQKFKEKYGFEFPLLSDPDAKVCEAYGVWKEKSMYGRKYMGIERTTVVIGPDGKIKKLFPKVKVTGHVDEVLGVV